MKKTIFLLFIFFNLTSCLKKSTIEEYPIIDIIGSVGKYQRIYCSDYFSSIELIPLETTEDCLLDRREDIIFNASVILMRGNRNNNLYAFDRTGMFKNEIGKKGQGPEEYISVGPVFFNYDRPAIYVGDMTKIMEYEYNGGFIRSINIPRPEDKALTRISYVGDNIFVGNAYYDGKNRFKYCLFNQKGDTVKTFPNHIFFDRAGSIISTHDASLNPVRVDNRLYLKDYINDTLYILTDKDKQPSLVFEFKKHTFSKERLENSNPQATIISDDFRILGLVGLPEHIFYEVRVPESFPLPESKPEYVLITNKYEPATTGVYGIYNIVEKTNILLDTDQYSQKGIINDLNGGLPFIPRYYAGNGIVADVWHSEEMKEMLTDEYFASQIIKDQKAHKKLKEILNNLKEDDNPVVIVAKLK